MKSCREVALLSHYFVLLSLHLVFIISGIMLPGIALAGAVLCGTFASLVVIGCFDRGPDERPGNWAISLYLMLVGLLILMDLGLAATDGEPFATLRRRS